MNAPDYDFKELSPYDFEALARDLLSRHEGITFSTYAIGRDGGIDLRAKDHRGVHVAQCKHTPEARRGKLLTHARKEKEKIDNSGVSLGRYLFLTTADISPGLEDDLLEILDGLADTVEVHGRGWLNALLSEHPKVERRHFKLWLKSSMAVSEMLRGGVFLRGHSRVSKIKRNYMRFVHHVGCENAERALADTGVAIISGAPGSGKTAIAEYLILQWWRRGYRVIVDPRTVDSWWGWLEDDVPTIFFFDDAWGQTRLHDFASSHYEKDFAEFLASVLEKRLHGVVGENYEKVVVITSRSLIMHDLLRSSDSTSHLFEGLPDSIVRVEKLPHEVRARILFNHVNSAFADQRMRDELATGNWWHRISAHRNYSPRIIELVTARRGFKSGHEIIDALDAALQDPKEIWEKSFNSLSSFEQLFLSMLAVSSSRGSSSVDLARRLRSHSMTDLSNALGRLTGTWVERTHSTSIDLLDLADPSQRDFLVHHLARESMACLDVIKNTDSIGDLALICERGRPPELEYQQSLFSFEEDSLRNSLDGCASLLLEKLRATFDYRLDEIMRQVGGQPAINDLVEAFRDLTRALIYQADRYAVPDTNAMEVAVWFEASVAILFPLLDQIQFETFGDALDSISDMAGTLGDLTENRVFPEPYAEMIEGLRLAVALMWEEWDVQVQGASGLLGFSDAVHAALVDQPGVFREIGLTRTAKEVLDVELLDAELASRIEEDPFRNWDWVTSDLEHLLKCRLDVSRTALAILAREEDRAFRKGIKPKVPRIQLELGGPEVPSGEVDVLFRSLAVSASAEDV
ncbi:restriction endonuclease [Streptomyces sp. NBC_00271]|uniref:nSTAND3 domain-containing NTPase n=1 Tax=Streptomyces sp. NBC_00271 TaxID=2975697 RepID=UPI002E2AB6D6|nr:restriction endonuclease [Streptomyces sp. NBC_00271]